MSADPPLMIRGKILPDEVFDRIMENPVLQPVDHDHDHEILDISSIDSEEIRSDAGTQEEQAQSKDVELADNRAKEAQAQTEDEAREDAEREAKTKAHADTRAKEAEAEAHKKSEEEKLKRITEEVTAELKVRANNVIILKKPLSPNPLSVRPPTYQLVRANLINADYLEKILEVAKQELKDEVRQEIHAEAQQLRNELQQSFTSFLDYVKEMERKRDDQLKKMLEAQEARDTQIKQLLELQMKLAGSIAGPSSPKQGDK